MARVCNVLLGSVGRGALWSTGEPSTKALSLHNSSGKVLSGEERTMLLLAWALWDGGGGLRVSDLLKSLKPERLALVGALLDAMSRGEAGLAEWLGQHEKK